MVTKLVEYLTKCDDAYYNSSNPLVSDATYDALIETLRRLEPTNPYLGKVGATVRSNKIGRLIPMGTLPKLHKDEEVKKWLWRFKSDDVLLVSPKYDGFAVELVYKEGKLVSAGTRGDGSVGENVYDAMLKIVSIPHSLSTSVLEYDDVVIVRGEVIAPKSSHDMLKSLGYTAMRNAVPGIVRACRSDALPFLDFIAYEFIDDLCSRDVQRSNYKKSFLIEDYRLVYAKDFEEIQSRREELRSPEYDYEIDGIVLKSDSIPLDGDDYLHPELSVAWKYKSNLETTILRDVEFNVGATGAISVVGVFDPVEFQGATLTRASFGSLDLYRKMHPRIGDLIAVSRRGDIIPYIEGVVLEESDGIHLDIYECPHCKSPLADNKCVNKKCPEILRLKLTQFIRGIGVKGIGESLVRGLISKGIVTSIPDVYNSDARSILEIPRQGESSVKKWKDLQDKELQPVEILTAYPFDNIGRKIWETLLSKFTYAEIINLTEDELREANLKGIGETKIKSTVSQIKENKSDLECLGEYHYVL